MLNKSKYIILFVLWINIFVRGDEKVCFDPSSFCLQLYKYQNDMIFTISGPPQAGYMAIGLGNRMNNSDIFVTYFDDQKHPHVSYRRGINYNVPKPIVGASLELGNNSIITPQFQIISFKRSAAAPYNGTVAINSNRVPMIWAYSHKKPNLMGQIQKHDYQGTFIYEFNNYKTIKKNSLPTNSFILWHGTLMIIAWLVLPAIAIYVARFIKASLSKSWFFIHSGLFVLIGDTSIVSVIFVALSQGNALNNPHAILGVVILSLYGIQITLGIIITKLRHIPLSTWQWRDQTHKWLGRLIWPLAIINTFYGIILLDNPLSLWIPVLLIILIIIGMFSYQTIIRSKKLLL